MYTEAAMRCGRKCLWLSRCLTMLCMGIVIYVLAVSYAEGTLSKSYYYVGLNAATLAAGGLLTLLFLRRPDDVATGSRRRERSGPAGREGMAKRPLDETLEQGRDP